MKKILLGLALVLGGLNACTSAVSVEKRANVNFNEYRTFDFAETKVKSTGEQSSSSSLAAQERIKLAVTNELIKRGLSQTTSKPDLLVSTHSYVDQAERTVYNTYAGPGYAYPYMVGYGGAYLPINYGYWYTPSYYQRPRTVQYTQGTVIIDFIDRRTNNLVWRGSMDNPVDDTGRLGSEFSLLAKDILDKFPIRTK